METDLFKALSLADDETINELILIEPEGDQTFKAVMTQKLNKIKQDDTSITLSSLTSPTYIPNVVEFAISEKVFDIVPIGDPVELSKNLISNKRFELLPTLFDNATLKYEEIITITVQSGNFITLASIFTLNPLLHQKTVDDVIKASKDNENSQTVILGSIVIDKFCDRLINHISLRKNGTFIKQAVKYALQYKATNWLIKIFQSLEDYDHPNHIKDYIADEIFDGSIRNDVPSIVVKILSNVIKGSISEKEIINRALDYGAKQTFLFFTKETKFNIDNSVIKLAIKSGIINDQCIAYIQDNGMINDQEIIDFTIDNFNYNLIQYFIERKSTTALSVFHRLLKINRCSFSEKTNFTFLMTLRQLISRYIKNMETHISNAIVIATDRDDIEVIVMLSEFDPYVDYMKIATDCSTRADIVDWVYTQASMKSLWSFKQFEDTRVRDFNVDKWLSKKKKIDEKIKQVYSSVRSK